MREWAQEETHKMRIKSSILRIRSAEKEYMASMQMDIREPRYTLLEWKDVHIDNGFWWHYQALCIDVTLPIELDQMRHTGRLDALKGGWREGDPNKPHFFWDSDIAKWIEAVAYSLSIAPNDALEAEVDEMIARIERLQQPDGYINMYYILVEPGKRFTYVKRMHELYCLGHLIEAAVAYYRVRGKKRLLDVVCRYVDLVYKVFGPAEEGKLPGYDGHEEIELALMKLYAVTGDQRHLTLSRYFVKQRGQEPHFFDEECERRGEPLELRKYRDDMQGKYAYYQAHMPAREQRKAVGHAVRATYFYCGMQDVAMHDGDSGLQTACDCIWHNIAETQLYITGGIGPNPVGERFAFDYQLPNGMSYNETCASIGLFLFSARKLCDQPRGEYGDVMERCLYNNIIGSISLSGDRFYYANPLSVQPEMYEQQNESRPQITVLRQKWFDVACCPPNLARLLMSLSGYIYLRQAGTLYVNLYIGSSTAFAWQGAQLNVHMETAYPVNGDIQITISVTQPVSYTLGLRLPAWSQGDYRLLLGGEAIPHRVEDDYALIDRVWEEDTTLTLRLGMRPRVTEADPRVADDCGRVALERGPLVYCIEEADNGPGLHDIRIDPTTVREEPYNPALLGGIVPLRAGAWRRKPATQDRQTLYREWGSDLEEVSLRAIPFYTRYNRGGGEMTVWMLNHL